MDGRRFDETAKSLASQTSRRAVIRTVGSGIVGGALGAYRRVGAGAAGSLVLGEACSATKDCSGLTGVVCCGADASTGKKGTCVRAKRTSVPGKTIPNLAYSALQPADLGGGYQLERGQIAYAPAALASAGFGKEMPAPLQPTDESVGINLLDGKGSQLVGSQVAYDFTWPQPDGAWFGYQLLFPLDRFYVSVSVAGVAGASDLPLLLRTNLVMLSLEEIIKRYLEQ